MKLLILMRHAKSDWNVAVGDKDRPLNSRGRESSPRMAAWLSENEYWPEHVLCSSATRTRETLDRMMATQSTIPSIKHCDSLYLAPSNAIWETVCLFWKSEPVVDRLLVLGHNPGMEELVSKLMGQRVEMPTAAIALFAFADAPRIDQANQIVWSKLQIPKELPS